MTTKGHLENLWAVAYAVEHVSSMDYFMYPPSIGRGTPLPIDERLLFVVEFDSCTAPLGMLSMRYRLLPNHPGGAAEDFMSIYVQQPALAGPQACRAALAKAIREIAASRGQLVMASIEATQFSK